MSPNHHPTLVAKHVVYRATKRNSLNTPTEPNESTSTWFGLTEQHDRGHVTPTSSRDLTRGLWTRQRETVVLYSLSLSLKTLDTGILLWAFFTLELEVDYPSETSRCTDAPFPHRNPFSDFFLGEEAAVHRLSETDNPYPNCPSKLTHKVRWIVHSKLKAFHFQTKTYYLSDANYDQTDNPSHANHPSEEWKRSFLL